MTTEGEREREIGSEGGREREREGERGRGREREGERDFRRCVINHLHFEGKKEEGGGQESERRLRASTSLSVHPRKQDKTRQDKIR